MREDGKKTDFPNLFDELIQFLFVLDVMQERELSYLLS